MNGMWTNLAWILAQDAGAVAEQAQKAGVSWQLFAVGAAVFILPFVLGTLLAQGLRLKDLGFKFGVVLFSIFFSLAPFIYQQLTNDKGWTSALKMGIDLAGGTNLVYQIDLEKAKAEGKTIDAALLDKMVQAVSKRINPSGAEEVTVRRVGNDRIEVIIPGADKDVVEQKKRAIIQLGSLEFAILANERDHAIIIQQARQLPEKNDEVRKDGRVIASWRRVSPKEEDKMGGHGEVAIREVKRRDEKGREVTVRQFLVVHDPLERAVTGKYLTRAGATLDPSEGMAVSFSLNTKGGILFGELTGKYQPNASDGFRRRLAILLDGQIHSAPEIRDRIPSGNVQITGRFTQQEVDALIGVLNAGALEVPLITTPVSEFTISPLLGIDVQREGLTAIVFSALAVFLFMLVYYRAAGFIAVLCLLLNLVLVVGAMAFIEATFTLPGLAGLVLTIGMAVDSNVLIYERMREELARGASLRMAIQNGFEKAFSAIFDGNVTTLITAFILYIIGSDQIRGFAVSLFIGLVMSLFSVLYFGHMCFNVAERKRWITKLNMMQFLGETHIDYLSWRKPAFLLSSAVILAGMIALYVRGQDNMDIDFTGGTMVTFEFQKPQNSDEVQQKLDAVFPGGVSLEQLTLGADEAGRRFRIRTTEDDQKVVREQLNKAFSEPGKELRKVTLEFDAPVASPEKLSGILAEKIDPDRFTGGHMVHLKLNGGVAEGTMVDYLAQQLKAIHNAAGQSKYDAPQTLVSMAGTTQADAGAKQDGGARYTDLQAFVAKDVDAADLQTALATMQTQMANEPVLDEINSFDTSVGDETRNHAFWAVIASLVMIVIYMWFRFEKVYFGLAAVAALAHDVLVTLGSIALAAYLSKTPIGQLLLLDDFKVNMGLIASLLTIVGYSLNDTIVIFDRIREIRGKNPNITYDMINLSVNQTMSRTILTALTVLIVVVILYIFGGDGIHVFAFSMIVGTITGCYSTIFIANPVLLWLVTRAQQGPAHAAPPKAVPA